MSWRYGAELNEYPLCFGHIKTNTILSRVKWRSYSIKFKEVPDRHNAYTVDRFQLYFFIFAEDILDEVSGLTVNSPDETLEEGPQLLLQSPGGHQEDKLSMGTRQKVGCSMHIRRYDRVVRACGLGAVFHRLHHRPGDKLYTVQSPSVNHTEECLQQVAY